jgi:non-ribosomal peptide synthetase component F
VCAPAPTPIAVDPGIARFDLAIELGATDDGYAGYLEYDTSLFDPATAAAYAADFRAILDAVGCHPDHPLSDLEPVRDILSRRTNHGGQVSHGT